MNQNDMPKDRESAIAPASLLSHGQASAIDEQKRGGVMSAPSDFALRVATGVLSKAIAEQRKLAKAIATSEGKSSRAAKKAVRRLDTLRDAFEDISRAAASRRWLARAMGGESRIE